MNWQETYQSKLVSMDDAVSIIRPGERVFYSMGANAPLDMLNALSRRLPELGKIKFMTAVGIFPYEYINNPVYKGMYEHHTGFRFFTERISKNKEDVYTYPIHFSQFPAWIDEIKPEVLLCECPPPDENGYLNFGPYGIAMNDYISKKVSKIIVQVNKNNVHVYGEQNSIHVSKVTAIVEQDHGFFDLPIMPITDVESKIASLIVDRIEDGSTIQIGIGGLANAVCTFLNSKKDIGIHSEMFADSFIPLIKSGVINGAKKTLHPGEVTVSFGGTSVAALSLMNRNPAIRMYPATYINDPNVIAKNDNLVSINNAIMVDLTGQVAAESIGFTQFSGTGGQVDFIRGARMSKNGKSFITLASCMTKMNDPVSKIVSNFPPGQVVTTPRSDVDMIVTEYGIAELRGKNLMERAKAMIAIAHPEFRDELTIEAKKAGLL